jgi:FkbM family methyltransferase
MTLNLPNSGAAAQLFYRQFSSAISAETTIQFLRPGGTMFDVGAHVGEYTAIAARCVGSHGVVHAFEPQTELQSVLRKNVQSNRLTNVVLHQCAVTDRTGIVALVVDRNSMGGWINDGVSIVEQVPAVSLDDFIDHEAINDLAFIKLDAAGNERAALAGALQCLERFRPIIICKLYNPDVTQARFGYSSRQVFETLSSQPYTLYVLDGATSPRQVPISSFDQVEARFSDGEYCLHILGLPEGCS